MAASATLTMSVHLHGMRMVQFFIERIALHMVRPLGGQRTAALMQFAGRWGLWATLRIGRQITVYRPAKTLTVTWHEIENSISTDWDGS
jgi:hypothetical protein